jgi:hypothetical protein
VDGQESVRLPSIDDDDPEVPDELIQAACQKMGVTCGSEHTSIRSALREAAAGYLIDLSLEPLWGTPKQQRAAFRKLSKSLVGTLQAMSAIAPEYAVALDGLGDWERSDPPHPPIFSVVRDRILDLAFVVGRFDAEYEPNRGRPVNVPLEQAVRRLIDVVEPVTGEFPMVRLNKHKDGNPTLGSRGSEAIGLLLCGVHPALNEATVARMIEKVRWQPRESESHLEALFRLDPGIDLDCSLRREPEGP